MAYSIYLLDRNTSQYIQLDTDPDLDFKIIYDVNDYSDISKREDVKTEEFSLKDTKTNRYAIGDIFNLNRFIDTSIPNQLFFNYNPITKVDCLVYKNDELFLSGTMMITESSSDNIMSVTSKCVITGKIVDFFSFIKDKKLSELDLTDLKHPYRWDVMTQSTSQRMAYILPGTSSVSYTNYATGSGYIYPFVDYGSQVSVPSLNNFVSYQELSNFKPALFVNEIINRIVTQAVGYTGSTIGGYTWEYKGSPESITRFKSLVLLDNQEKLTRTVRGGVNQISRAAVPYVQTSNFVGVSGTDEGIHIVPFDSISPSIYIDNSPFYMFDFAPSAIAYLPREVSSNGLLTMGFTFSNEYNIPVRLSIEVCSRSYVVNTEYVSGWDIIASKDYNNISLRQPSFLNTINNLQLVLPQKTYPAYTQFCVRMRVKGSAFPIFAPLGCQFTVTSFNLRLPKDISTSLTYGIRSSGNTTGTVIADNYIPVLSNEVSQYDFIKSIVSLYNIQVYNSKDNPKHLIFESYNDFTVLTRPEYLVRNSLDWSRKVHLPSIKQKYNTQLPKSYLWTYKEDSDYLNATYKSRNGKIYGDRTVLNTNGSVAQNKIELIFSPTPHSNYNGSDRYFPGIYSGEGLNRKPMKSNPRIVYYNGLTPTTGFNALYNGIGISTGNPTASFNLVYDSAGSTWFTQSTSYTYPQVSEYYAPGGATASLSNVKEQLVFEHPDEIYFSTDNSDAAYNTPDLYDLNYQNMIVDLTNPNFLFIECQAYLSFVDVSNFDPKIPVYIDTGKWGNGYFRVLKLEYQSDGILTKLEMIKITTSNRNTFFVPECSCVDAPSFNLPDAETLVVYNYVVALSGDTGQTITLNNVVKPSWMSIDVYDGSLFLYGTPALSDMSTGNTISFDIISCGGDCIESVSSTIDIYCTCVTIDNFNMSYPAILENSYSYTTQLLNTVPGNSYEITNLVKPSWMGVTVSLGYLTFTGTPHIGDVSVDSPVSFDIVSCNGTCVQSYSTTIDVECGCVMINPESSFNPPNAEVGVTYSYVSGLVGTFTGNVISLTGVSKPSWMGITISGTNLVLSGFPSVSDINYMGVTVSFTLTSCNGTCVQSYSDTITVNCECVEFEGVFSPPNAIIDDPYSFSVQLGGSLNQNIQIVDLVRPPWMSATISSSLYLGLTVLNLYGTPLDGYGYDSPSEPISLGLQSCGGRCTNYVSATISVLGCDAIYYAKPLYLTGATATIEFNVGDNVFCGTNYRLQNSSGSFIATGSVYATYSNPSNITVSKLDIVGLSEGATYSLYFEKDCCYTTSRDFVFSFTASTCECVVVDGSFAPTNATEGVPYVYSVPLDGSLGVYHHLDGILKPDWMSIGISGSSVYMTGTPALGDADTGVDVGFTILSCEYFGGCVNPYYTTIDVIGSTANNSYVTNNTDVPLTGFTILLQGLGGTPEETFDNGGFGYSVGANSTTHFYIPNRSGLQLVSIKVPFVSFDGATAYLSTVGIPAFHNNGPIVIGGDDLEFFNGEGYAITNGMGITISSIPNPF